MEAALTAVPDPRPRRKVEQILAAAGHLFREHGYALTSMDAVAQAADVSKATLYAYFVGKHELFAAVISDEGDQRSRALVTDDDAAEDIEAKLVRYGHAIQALLIAAETISSYRMVVGEAGRLPDLGRAYYDNGAGRLLSRLEEFFAGAMESGRLRTADPRRAAEQFVGLVRGDLMLRALLGVYDHVSAEERDDVVRAGVDTFCRSYRAEAAVTVP